MGQIVDDDAQEIFDEKALERARKLAHESVMEQERSMSGTGVCLYCGEAIAGNVGRWCSVACRDDWERSHKNA